MRRRACAGIPLTRVSTAGWAGVEELPDILAERGVWGGRRVRGMCVGPVVADCLPEGAV